MKGVCMCGMLGFPDWRLVLPTPASYNTQGCLIGRITTGKAREREKKKGKGKQVGQRQERGRRGFHNLGVRPFRETDNSVAAVVWWIPPPALDQSPCRKSVLNKKRVKVLVKATYTARQD